jgi:hypothetical protein
VVVLACSVCVVVLYGRSMLLCVRHGRGGDGVIDTFLFCVQLNFGRNVGVGSSTVIYRASS